MIGLDSLQSALSLLLDSFKALGGDRGECYGIGEFIERILTGKSKSQNNNMLPKKKRKKKTVMEWPREWLHIMDAHI